MSEAKHTPLPWRAEEPSEERDTLTRIVSSDDIMLVHAHSYPKYSTKHPDADVRRANAALIVRAVNNYHALVNALDTARWTLLRVVDSSPAIQRSRDNALAEIDAALTAAKGEA